MKSHHKIFKPAVWKALFLWSFHPSCSYHLPTPFPQCSLRLMLQSFEPAALLGDKYSGPLILCTFVNCECLVDHHMLHIAGLGILVCPVDASSIKDLVGHKSYTVYHGINAREFIGLAVGSGERCREWAGYKCHQTILCENHKYSI